MYVSVVLAVVSTTAHFPQALRSVEWCARSEAQILQCVSALICGQSCAARASTWSLCILQYRGGHGLRRTRRHGELRDGDGFRGRECIG